VADSLAGQVAVIAAGRVIAEGTPDQLKRKVGQERLEITLVSSARIGAAVAVLASASTVAPVVDADKGTLSLQLDGGIDGIASVSAALAREGIAVDDFAIRRPTLDDVFLTLTGHL
jgi:ABC-2 type transport system ATP-binding protein